MPTAQLLVTELDNASSSATAVALPGLGETGVTFDSAGLWSQIATDGNGNYAAIKESDTVLAFSSDDGATWTEDTTSVGFAAGLCWDNHRRQFVAFATAASGPAVGQWQLWFTDNGTWTPSANNQLFTGLLHQSPTSRLMQLTDVYLSIETAAGAFGEIDFDRYYLASDPDTFTGFLFAGPFNITGTAGSMRVNSRFRGKETFPRFMAADNADPSTSVWVFAGGSDIARNGAAVTFPTGGADEYHLVIPDGAGNWLACGFCATGWGYAVSNDAGVTWTGSQDTTSGYEQFEAWDGIWDGTSYWVVGASVSGADRAVIFEYDPIGDSWTKHDLPTGGAGNMAATGWPQPALFVPLAGEAEAHAHALDMKHVPVADLATAHAHALDMSQYTRADLDVAEAHAEAPDMGPYIRADLDVAQSHAHALDMTREISGVQLTPLTPWGLGFPAGFALPAPATTEALLLVIVTGQSNSPDIVQIEGDPNRRYLQTQEDNGHLRVTFRLYKLEPGDENVTVRMTDQAQHGGVLFPYLVDNYARIPADLDSRSFAENAPGDTIHTGTWTADDRGQMLVLGALRPGLTVDPPASYAVDNEAGWNNFTLQTAQRGAYPGAQPDHIWDDGTIPDPTSEPFPSATAYWIVFYDIGLRIREGAAYRASAGIFTERPGAAEPEPPAKQHPQREHPLPPDPDPIELPLPPWVPGTGPYRRAP